MQVEVSIKDDTGGELGNAVNTVYQTNVFDKYGDQADAEIARIITENAGPNAGQPQKSSSGSKAAAKLM
jgi:membrane fusion protein (multidrug efflux system)